MAEARRILQVELELIQQLSKETNQDDLSNLHSLISKVKAARITYDAVKQNTLPDIQPTRQINPNENVTRQTRFVSTKKKHKPLRIKFAKPTQEEKESFMKIPTWLNSSYPSKYF